MAEHDLKLVISADTSDAEKKLKEIGTTKVSPVKVDVTAEKVKVDTPKIEPVKVPVAVDATSSSRQVKKVVDSISDATRTSRPQIKPEIVQPKPVTVQAKFDTTGIGAFVKQLHGVREIASRVVSALGLVGFAVGIAMSVANAFIFLKEKIEETKKAVAKLRFDAEMRSAAAETNRLVTAHERLARVLKDELDTLSKQKAVGDIEKQGKRDLEDGRRAAARARQMLDAKTPEEEQALRDRFAREDAAIATRRKQEDRRERIYYLDQEESGNTQQVNRLKEKQKQTDEQLKNEELNVKRARGSRKDGEEMSEQEKAARARVESLKAAKKANELAIATYEKEAKFRRDQIAALKGIQDADTAQIEALKQQQAKKEKARENDRQTTEADRDWKERRDREAAKKSIEDAVDSQTTNGDKKAILDAQAETFRNEANALRRQYEDEMKKSPETRDAEKLADLRGKIDALESDADAYEKRSRDITREDTARSAGDLEAFADRLDAASGVSQNRLTAMGLGAGVTRSDVSSDVRKLVDLMRQNVNATKNIKMPDPSGVSVYAE